MNIRLMIATLVAAATLTVGIVPAAASAGTAGLGVSRAAICPEEVRCQQDVVFTGPDGLHVRLAAQFVKEAKGFESAITVTANGRTVSGKSLFGLQTLGVTQGTVVTISAEGGDARQAVEHLSKLLAELG